MKSIYKILLPVFLFSTVIASVTVTGSKSGSRDVTGYFNETNGVTITVTLSGADAYNGASDKSNQFIYVDMGFSSTSSISSYSVDMSSLTNYPVSPLKCGNDNTVDISITASNISDGDGWAQGKYFDFQIYFINNSSAKYEVDFDGGASGSLKYETDDPWLNTFSYPGNYFNTQQVIYQPDENLSSTYTSTITFTGTAGSDNGTSHVYNLGTQSGNEILTGSNSTVSLSGQMSNGNLVDGSTYTLTFALYDVAGNYYSASYTSRVYDTTLPTISSISTSTADGTYNIGDAISYTINFSEDVTASGTVNVTFETGTSDEVATITSGNISSTNSVTATYTVVEGNTSNDLAIKTIAMASGNLYDDASNNMSVFTISGSNLNDIANIAIDGVKPTISSITSSSANGSYSTGETIDITLNFSEDVTSTGNITVTLETGSTDRTVTISNITSASSASGTYTVQSGDESSDLEVKSVSGTLADDAGNTMTSMAIPNGSNLDDASAIVIETTAPIIGSITSSASAGTYGIGASIPITVNFINGSGGAAEAVTLSSGSFDLTLETGTTDAEVSAASISSATSASLTYTVSENESSSDLDVSSAAISGGGSITDAAGNTLSDFTLPTTANLADNEDIVIEATRPIISSVTSTTADGTYKAGDAINITLQFSEAVTLAGGTLDITFDMEGTDQTLNVSAFTNANSISSTYTVQEGDTTADLSISSIALGSGATLRDVVTNSPNAMTNFTPTTSLATNKNIAIDGVLPTITRVTSTSNNDSYGVGESVNVTVSFYEPVTLSGGNLVITLETGGTDRTVTISSITNSMTASGTYTVQSSDVSSDLEVKTIALSAGNLEDAAGNAMTDFSIPAGSNIDDLKDIIIDGTAPSAFTTGDVTTVASTSTFVIDNYWNEMNTDVDVTVPLASDNSLVGGTVQIRSKVDANAYVSVGAATTITSSYLTAGSVTVRIDKSESANTDLEELTGFGNGGVLYFNAILTDLAGNSTTGTASSTTITIDTTAATIASATSSTNDALYNTGDNINVSITTSDAVTLTGGTLSITLETGSTDNSVSITSVSNTTSISGTYTVLSGDSNSDLSVKSLSVSSGYLIDAAGNPMSTADLAIPTGSNISDTKNIEIDGINPDAFTVGSVTTTGGNVYSGYWNSTNTGLDIVVPIADDASLVDGTVQIRGKVNSNSFENFGASNAIALSDLDGNKTISITAGQFEGLTNFADNVVVTITAVITDEAGNATTGTGSSTTLTIDQTLPSSFTTGSVSPDGNVETAGYYNKNNTGAEVRVPLSASDNSLTGGKIRILSKLGSAISWQNLSDYFSISSANFSAGYKICTVDSGGTDSTEINELTGFADEGFLYFNAILYDVAGNQRTGTQSSTTLQIDITEPSVTSVSSTTGDGNYKSGDDVNIDVNTSETVYATGTPQIQLETGTADATVNYSSGSASSTLTFVYTVDDGHSSADLEVKSANALALNSGTIRDIAGNNLVLTLPIAASGNSLSDNQDIIIDTDEPTAIISYSDSLVKENDIVTVTVTFSEEMTSSPQIAILYAGGTQLTATNMSQSSALVWTKSITIPDGNDGAATVTITATDLALNALTTANTTGRTAMRVDNTHPSFTLLSPDSGEYVNHTLVGYKLSETSFSGSVTWTRIGGTADGNSPHISTLTAAELDEATTFSDYTLTNVPTNLVSGTRYRLNWSATDSAGNVSANTFVSTPVYYDTTAPTVELTYTHYFASEDTVVTITATFNERALPTPRIAINYQGVGNDVSATNMTMGADSTIWTYDATIPAGTGNNGYAIVTLTAQDLASNTLRAADVAFTDTLLVDNTVPTITLTYTNLTQTQLDNEGKSEDLVEISAEFSEKANASSPPVLNVEFADSTADSFVNESAFSSSNNDSVWTYRFSLPEGSANDGILTAFIVAKDLAGNFVVNITNDQVFSIDNTPPASFNTGNVTPMGQNQVTGWYNSTLDSIRISAPIPSPASDPSIQLGGKMNIQIFNIVRGTGWVTIPTQDSIAGSGNNVNFFRTKAEIESLLVPGNSLLQGDTLLFRAVMSDRVGNSTNGDTSVSKLIYDPFPPTLGEINGLVFFNQDTIVSSDSISASWTDFTDSVYLSIDGSGLSRYDYKIQHYNASGTYVNNLKEWTNIGLNDEIIHTDLALTHNHLYSLHIRAVDAAGNISDIMNSDTIRRVNSAPIITLVTETMEAYEDLLFTQTIEFTDADTSTLSGDSWTFEITTTHQFGHVPETPAEFLSGQNVINWTPTQADTGLYTADVIIIDNWTFSDTITYNLLVIAVNDTPAVIVLTPNNDQTMMEDQIGQVKFLLSQYGSDVDNDSTELTWQAAVLDTANKPGYPTSASLFFGPRTPQTVKERLINQYFPGALKQSGKDVKNKLSDKSVKHEISEIRKSIPVRDMYKTAANYIEVKFTDTTGVWWAEFEVDSNYFGTDHRIIFFVSDTDGATAQDTILLTISPENDSPIILDIPLFEITENQFRKIDFADYITDVDDTTLTIRVAALTYDDQMTITTSASGASTIVDSLQFYSSGYGDSVIFTPDDEWSDSSLIQVSVIDGQNARASKTFVIDIIRVPRPNLSLEVIQNNAFTNYFEVIVTDTVLKTDSLFLTVQGQRIDLDTVAAYTYVGHYSFENPGTYTFYSRAWGVVGDTTITRSVNLALAKTFYSWSGRSPDGNFKVKGSRGAVSFDQTLLIVDSTMFSKYFHDQASYKLGKETWKFDLPVEVSFLNMNKDLAIYQKIGDVEWVELPSINENGEIKAYTNRMGYFRLGPRTFIVPGQTNLHQNYPNPFNPTTTITYDVGFYDGPKQHIHVAVFNILGQQVKTLVNEYKNIGRYSMQWDGKDEKGIAVASGVYFVRMMNNFGNINSKKMMLVR